MANLSAIMKFSILSLSDLRISDASVVQEKD